MKRRKFLQGLVAGAGVVAVPVPLPVAAKPVAAVATAAPNLAAFHYGWACVFAQMNNGITPADIVEKFGVTPDKANALFDRMMTRGVLHPPGLDGRSHATRPWQPWDKRAPLTTADEAPKDPDKAPQNTTDTDQRADAFRMVMAHVTDDASFGWAVA